MRGFDLFKKKETPEEKARNFPEMLIAKLLFTEKPDFDRKKIQKELHEYFSQVASPASDNLSLYFFPEYEFEMAGAKVHGQCVIFDPNDMSNPVDLSEEAFQQNWDGTPQMKQQEIANMDSWYPTC